MAEKTFAQVYETVETTETANARCFTLYHH